MMIGPVRQPFSLTALHGSARALLLLGTVTIIGAGLDLPLIAAAASVTALLVPLSGLARRHFAPGSSVTPILAAFTLFWFVMLVTTEMLSALSLLGSRVAWCGTLLGIAVVLQTFSGRWHRDPDDARRLDVLPARQMQHEPWTIVVVPVALALGALFLQSVYLDLFTGINHADGQTYYTARAVRYLQDGNLFSYSTVNDFLPYLHQSLSAYLLLFTGTASSIIVLSAVFGGFVGLTLFDLSRLTRVPVSLSVLVGVSPMAVPIFNIHLSTSQFDVHTSLFILLCIYFLAVAWRVSGRQYCMTAACAASLALAMKLTFFFAAPGLLVLWVATLVHLRRCHAWRSIARVGMAATLIVALGGAHFLRNAWTQGFLISPREPEYGQASLSSPEQAFEQLTFNVLASTTILMTPSILVNGERVAIVDQAYRSVNESLGLSLPNPRLTDVPGRTWIDMLAHLRTPFASDKAGFGAVIPLAVAPAAILVVVTAVRRRAFFTLPVYILAYATLYLVTIGLSLRYTTSMMRYLVEIAVPLLVLLPLLVARLPATVGLVYLAMVSAFLVTDAVQAFRENEQRPPDRVTLVPSEEQYAAFFAPEVSTFFEGARVLDQKYPVEEWPEIYLLKEVSTPLVILEYPFLDAQARRRVVSWSQSLDQPQPAWPGPFLVLSPTNAQTLESRFGDEVVLDRLSDQVWLALPRDRLRVLWRVDVPDDAQESVVRFRAVATTGRYRDPQFRFSAIRSSNGAQVQVLRGFAPDAQFTLPSSALSRVFDLQVEVREAGASSTSERLRIPERRMLTR